MKNQEAKFILGAYRHDGRDAGDPAFASALEQAEHDPELRAWFAAQRKFDAALSARLQTIGPPPGLREAILAGARLGAAQAKRRWWANPMWLATAAGIVLAAVVTRTVWTSLARPAGADFASFALRELAESHDNHVGHPPELAKIQADLTSTGLPLTSNLKLDFGELNNRNCRAMTMGGKRVFEICFQRDGIWYHVYVGRRSDFAPGTFDPKALMNVRGEYASTVWADASHVYALVTQAGAQALRRVI